MRPALPAVLAGLVVLTLTACPAGAVAPPDIASLEKPALLAKSLLGDTPPDTTDRGFDVQHYALNLEIDPGAGSLIGRVTTDLELVEPPPAVVRLDLVATLQVDSVLWDGTPATYLRSGDELRIDRPPAAAGAAAVTVRYHGQPQPEGEMNSGMLFRTFGTTPSDPIGLGPSTFTVSEPWSANSWWPCKDHPLDKATATIAVTVPDTLRAVANGTLVDESTVRPGWRRFVWEESYPLSTYLIGLAVARYSGWTESCAAAAGPLPLSFHVVPEDETAARNDLARTCEMVQFLESILGPYPFPDERYGQMEVKWGGAMEHQTSTSLGRTFLPGTGYHQEIVLHELAHQWVGDLVTPAGWSDIWLNEGFASYAQALWLEHDEGRAAYLERMYYFGPGHPRHQDLLFADEGVLADPWPILPNAMVYHKGAWLLHMLRGAIGDAAFFAFLSDWTGDPARRYGHVTTADMISVASYAAGRDLGPFLDPWLYTAAVPDIAWRARVRDDPGGGSEVTVFATQRQDQLFELHLPVRVATAAGDLDTMLVLATTEDSLAIHADAAVADVLLDPEGWVLMHRDEIVAISAPPDSVPPSAGDQGGPSDVSGAWRPAIVLRPITPGVSDGRELRLRFRLSRAGDLSLHLYDLRGRRLADRDLGPYGARDQDYALTWQAVDRDGRPLPAGVYWLELRLGDRRDVRRLTIVH